MGDFRDYGDVQIVLVTGGRDYKDREKVFDILDEINPGTLIEGGASGVDRLAKEWAESRGVDVLSFPAQWDQHGKSAGPIRNRQMAEFLQDAEQQHAVNGLVVVFPGGKGTANMRETAERMCLTVFEVFGD